MALKDIGCDVDLVDCGQGYKDFAPCVSMASSRRR